MKITVTLSEALQKCNDWIKFCDEFNYSEWIVNEGAGHIEQTMTLEQAIKHGIIKGELK